MSNSVVTRGLRTISYNQRNIVKANLTIDPLRSYELVSMNLCFFEKSFFTIFPEYHQESLYTSCGAGSPQFGCIPAFSDRAEEGAWVVAGSSALV